MKSTAGKDVFGCCAVHMFQNQYKCNDDCLRWSLVMVMRSHLVSYCFLQYMLLAAQCSLLKYEIGGPNLETCE